MDVSKFLSKVIGITLIIVSVAMLLNIHQFMVNVNYLINDSPLMFVTGLFTLILGALMVVSHNIWQFNWRVLVTLFAWLVFLKGAVIIFCPQIMNSATNSFLQSSNFIHVAACLDLAIGLMMSYFGFRR